MERDETELQKYFWTAKKLDELIKNRDEENEVNISRSFKEFTSDMKTIRKFFKYEKRESNTLKSSKVKTGGRYIFSKCLECRLILGIPTNVKKILAENLDREEVERFIARNRRFDKKQLQNLSDQTLSKLMKCECYFMSTKDADEDDICELYKNGRCTPYNLLEMFKLQKDYMIRGSNYYTYEYLRGVGDYLCRILPVRLNPKGFKSEWTRRGIHGDGEISAVNTLRYGGSEGWEKEKLGVLLHTIYLEQFNGTGLQAWLGGIANDYYREKKAYHLYKKLYVWSELWTYLIKRCAEMRIIVNELERKKGQRPLPMKTLYSLAEWECRHRNIYHIPLEEHDFMDQIKDDLGCTNSGMNKFYNEFCAEKINKVINEIDDNKDHWIEDDYLELKMDAFKDLECVLECMDFDNNEVQFNDYAKELLSNWQENYNKYDILELNAESGVD